MSDVSKVDGYQEGAYKAYRTIKTVYIPKWVSLSNADKEKIISERNKWGVKLGYGKESMTGNNLDNLKDLKGYNVNPKRKINS